MAFGAGGGPNCPGCWNGRDGWAGPNAAQSGWRWRWACAREQTLPGVAGEWWWASNECASLPKEGPLGPVLKQGHSRMWVTKWATASKCSNVTRFGTCVAVAG